VPLFGQPAEVDFFHGSWIDGFHRARQSTSAPSLSSFLPARPVKIAPARAAAMRAHRRRGIQFYSNSPLRCFRLPRSLLKRTPILLKTCKRGRIPPLYDCSSPRAIPVALHPSR